MTALQRGDAEGAEGTLRTGGWRTRTGGTTLIAVMDDVYREGRCRVCGMRVTVAGPINRHMRDGQWCGPIETDHPFEVPDEPPGDEWMVPSHGGAHSAPSATDHHGGAHQLRGGEKPRRTGFNSFNP